MPRAIDYSGKFKKDYKQVRKRQQGGKLDAELEPIIDALLNDRPLEERCRDHSLSGDWEGYRDCHVRPDLILIYKKVDKEGSDGVLQLAALGSHSDLFG